MVNDYILNWIDLAWVPLALLLVRKGQRLNALIFVLVCILTLRLQVELMLEIGFDNGFFKFIDLPVLMRGFMAYGVFIAVFIGLSRWSRERDVYVNMAAAITVYIAAFCVSTFIMLL
jgi:low affinity Fe/Cu permease